jgi:DNA-binding transcriptional regulator YiaG
MTPDEFRAALSSLGMSQREFANRFGLHWTSVLRWTGGTHAVPSWVPPVLALLEREHVGPER